MSESTSFFGWRQFLSSDSSNGLLSAFQFLTAAGAIGVSIAGLKDNRAAVIIGLLCGIIALFNATISGVHHFHPLFESRKILFILGWVMVALWVVVLGVWRGTAAPHKKGKDWGWTLGAMYIVNLCLALVAALVNTFIYRHQKKTTSEFDEV